MNSKSKHTKLVALLLDWFPRHARDLPWRRTRDPYAIWCSEIMLQQTQVKTVIPYWERWMRELPTIESLAHASADKIHKLWEGLGYYTRVRNMQKAAQQIIAVHSGQFPQTFDAVLALPGIGRYTAGAICSITFNQPTPILDGNVIRVLTRIHGIKTDPREKQTNAQLWQLAQDLVCRAKCAKASKERTSSPTPRPSRDSSSCSSLNQSLMELGALICTPRSPNCAACPVQTLCVAHKKDLQEQIPNAGKREKVTEQHFIAYVVERDGQFLVRQRPAGVVNGHLWEFPNVEVGADAGRARHSVRAATSHTPSGAQRTDASYQKTDFRITSSAPLHVVKHTITRYRITLEAWRAEIKGAPVSGPARIKTTPGRRRALHCEWRTLAQLHRLAFASAHRKILASLGAPIT